jgi:hypothetical protein
MFHHVRTKKERSKESTLCLQGMQTPKYDLCKVSEPCNAREQNVKHIRIHRMIHN